MCYIYTAYCSGELVTSEDVMSLLRPFCTDTSVSVQERMDILQVLEQVTVTTVKQCNNQDSLLEIM